MSSSPRAQSGGWFRFALIAAVLVIGGALVIAHGARGIALVVAVVLLLSVPQTRTWRRVEAVLVRITGSRRRAYALVGFVIVGAVVAVNVYELLHG